MHNQHKTITDFCRELRKRQTPFENKLWEALRNRRLNSTKFLRQHPLIYSDIQGQKFFFIADFYCDKHKLVIEADGAIHLLQKDYDKNRGIVISGLGIKVIRFSNDRIQGDLDAVIKEIQMHLV